MTVRLSVKADIRQLTRRLNSIQRKQVPFATSRAINDTLFDARAAEVEALPRHIDRPAPFTKRGYRVTKSHKRKLIGFVEIPPDRWKYMRYQVQGGVEHKTHAIPINARLNARGALGKGGVNRALKRKGAFIATINGRKGVWLRSKKAGLQLLVLFANKANYPGRYPFGVAARRSARARFAFHFNRRIKQALATAR